MSTINIAIREESRNVTINVPPGILKQLDNIRGDLVSRHKIFLLALQEYLTNHHGQVMSLGTKAD